MTTTDQNFEMWAGEDKDITVNLVDSAGDPFGDLTGLTFSWKMATSETATTTLRSSNGIISTCAAGLSKRSPHFTAFVNAHRRT